MSPDMAEALAKRRAEIVRGVAQWEVSGKNPLSPRDHLALFDRAEEIRAAADASDDMVDLASKALAEANNRLQGVTMERDRALAQRDALLAACEAALAHIDESQGTQAGSEETGSDFFDGANGTDARLLIEAAIAACRGGA